MNATSARSAWPGVRARKSVLPQGFADAFCVGFTLLVCIGLRGNGTSLSLLFMLSAIFFLSILPLRASGQTSISALLVLIIGLRFVLVAALYKLVAGESLEEHLIVPEKSFAIVMAFMAILNVCHFACERLPVTRLAIPRPQDVATLKFAGLAAALLGVIGAISEIGRIDDKVDVEAAGSSLLSFMRPLITLGIVLLTASTLQQSGGRKSFSPLVLGAIFLDVLIGFAVNSKQQLAVGLMGYLCTTILWRGRVSASVVITGLVSAILFVTLIGPIVNAVRTQKGELTRSELVMLSFNTVGDVLSGHQQADELRPDNNGDTAVWDFNYLGSSNPIGERFSLIQYLDPVVAIVDSSGAAGWQYVTNVVTLLMPRVLYPDKVFFFPPDVLYAELGMLDKKVLEPRYLTMPVIVAGYACGGLISSLLLTGAVYLALFASLRVLGIDSGRNALGIYFLIDYYHWMSEGDLMQHLGILTRILWLRIGVFVAVVYIGSGITAYLRRREHRAAA